VNYIDELRRAGCSVSKISEETGYDRKTVRKYLKDRSVPTYGPRTPRSRILDAYKEEIDKKLKAGVWNAVVIFHDLRKLGYSGGYTSIKDYVRPRRRESQQVAVRRFETEPGKQGQVDWGDLGDIEHPDGSRQSISVFVLTLGSSRSMFADLSLDQKLPALIRMHERAFAELGGVPEEILYDNMKTVVIRALTEGTDDRGEVRWNKTFLDFARYWGFQPRLCAPYRPQTKGKVESGVKYIRRNFLSGRQAQSLEDLANQLRGWLSDVANARVHGTTRRVVSEALAEEKPHLQPVGLRPPYPLYEEVTRKVSREAYVAFRANQYAAPWQYAGKPVVVRACDDVVRIAFEGKELARHLLCAGKHQVLKDEALHAGMPYAPSRRLGKAKITVVAGVAGAPQVEQRSLDVYDVYAQVGGCQVSETQESAA